MSIKSEITRLKDAKSVLRYWLMTKNVTVPGYATLSELMDLLSKVPVVDTEVVKVTVSNHTGDHSDHCGSVASDHYCHCGRTAGIHPTTGGSGRDAVYLPH